MAPSNAICSKNALQVGMSVGYMGLVTVFSEIKLLEYTKAWITYTWTARLQDGAAT